MTLDMRGKSLTSILDLEADEIQEIFRYAANLKAESHKGVFHNILKGHVLAMIFEKPSTRTRVSFETGIYQLGGCGLYLSRNDLQLGRGETIADTARVLSRYVDGIMARVFAHETIVELAKYSSVPVINGLCNMEHPCQALADLFTMQETFGTLKGLKLAYVGDGNNVCHSLMYICAKLGVNFSGAHPEGYFPGEEVIKKTRQEMEKTGATLTLGSSPHEAVRGADAIYTDVWVSMGDEREKEERLQKFAPYQVNMELLSAADSDRAIVLHCLPAHRGQEITDEVIDGPNSAVWDEAENRLHVQKALMALVM